jgi:hypothetical protein
LEIATDKKHGTARQMIVDGLGKFIDKKVISVLVGLLEDKDVQGLWGEGQIVNKLQLFLST